MCIGRSQQVSGKIFQRSSQQTFCVLLRVFLLINLGIFFIQARMEVDLVESVSQLDFELS